MASALEDDTPLWLRTADTSTLAIPSNIGLPPQDAYIPSTGYSFDDESLKRGRLQDLYIYGNSQKLTPGLDTVENPPRDIPDVNVDQGTVWPSSGRRAYVDLQRQYGTGGIQDEEALKSFYNNPKYEGAVTSGLDQQIYDTGPSYLRRTEAPSAFEPAGNILTQASYAGDTLSSYARDNAQIGGRSSVEGVSDVLAQKFNTMVAAMPPEIRARVEIQSGFRDASRQREVNPSVTNSRHTGTGQPGSGMALDLGPDPVVQDWIMKNPQYGLGFPLRYMGPKEYNHLEMIDPKTGVRMPAGPPGEQGSGSSTPPQTSAPPQASSATSADQPKPAPLHPVEIFENAVKDYPILHDQGLIAGPGKKLEYWQPNEPGTPSNPRPDYIPIDQAGMEISPDSTPMDVLGDVASHHMAQKDPVIKKYYNSFKDSMTDSQKEMLQAQYFYSTKHEGETRPYAAWEKQTGLPAYFRGYAFNQWPKDFNDKAYTPAQRYHFDQMMGYLRGGQQNPQAALQ